MFVGRSNSVNQQGNTPILKDRIGRVMRKLRVSLTDACNYRCFYCMPENSEFTPNQKLLKPEEYATICGRLVDLGIKEIRITGGEPTVRPEFRAILSALTPFPIERRGVTSNGQLLARHLDFLWDFGWQHLNISLDSLDPGRFNRITHGGDFRVVLDCIEKAVRKGFVLKINVVVFKGINDDELLDFANWSAITGIEVRFLEYMKIGPTYASHWSRFISAQEMMDQLETSMTLEPVLVPEDSTSFIFKTHLGGRLGFIASESQPFCGQCSRLRLSATGDIRSCLMSERGFSLRGVPPDSYPEILERVMDLKPLGRLDHIEQPMHAIGG